MRRRLLYNNNTYAGITINESLPGDIVLYDKTSKKLIIVPLPDFDTSKFTTTKFSGVGVVVTPLSHNLYNDNSISAISLKPMNYNTPTTGGNSEQYMMWGTTTISGVPNSSSVNSYSDLNQTKTSSITNVGYLPSDDFETIENSVQNPNDKDTWFYYKSPYGGFIPSPYNEDDTINTKYRSRATSYFNGKDYTKTIVEYRGQKDYSTWKPSNVSDDYPAASCCDMYYTDGTKQGDWYLPAMGELGYLLVKAKKINEAFEKLSSFGAIKCGYSYWSSVSPRGLSYNGGVGTHTITSSDRTVRAFLRIY